MSTKAILIDQQNDFTPSQLKDYLNDKIGNKSSGKQFTYQDIQQYTMRGKLPVEYGGFDIETKVKNQYLTILTIKGLRKKYGS